jgi:hypothetical protein
MDSETSTIAYSDTSSDYGKQEEDYSDRHGLLDYRISSKSTASRRFKLHLIFSHTLNAILLIIVVVLANSLQQRRVWDPTLGVYCKRDSWAIHTATLDLLRLDIAPANSAVEYHELHFVAALNNRTEYMGFPTNDTDKLWEDLYNCIGFL